MNKNDRYEVLIIEDHSLVAEAAAHKIANSPVKPLIEVRSSAPSALEALSADEQRWSLILLDLQIPGATGLSLAHEIARRNLASRTCVLTGAERPDYEAQIAAMDFQGYLLKGGGASASTLEDDLLRIVAGERVFRFSDAQESLPVVRLSGRQVQCLALAAAGRSSKEIARELGIHPGSVDRTINAARVELDCSSRGQAIARALDLGLISLAQA